MRTTQDGIEQNFHWVHADFMTIRRYQYWKAFTSGAFYQTALMDEDGARDEPGRVLWIDETAIYVMEALDCMVRFCDSLDIHDEDVTFRVRMEGLTDRFLVYGNRGLSGPVAPRNCTEHILSWESTLSIEEWRAGKVRLAAEGAAYLLARCNWPELSGHDLEKFIFDYLNGSFR